MDMTVIRRVERCPKHPDVPAMFLLDGTMRKPSDDIIASECPVRGCRNHGMVSKNGAKHIRLPVIDPPEVVEP